MLTKLDSEEMLMVTIKQVIIAQLNEYYMALI